MMAISVSFSSNFILNFNVLSVTLSLGGMTRLKSLITQGVNGSKKLF